MYDNLNQIKAAETGRPSTEIEGCMTRAGNAASRLHTRLDALADRLSPVMRATGSGIAGAPTAQQEALSPLGDAIRSVERRIDGACDRLEAMLNGLAL